MLDHGYELSSGLIKFFDKKIFPWISLLSRESSIKMEIIEQNKYEVNKRKFNTIINKRSY